MGLGVCGSGAKIQACLASSRYTGQFAFLPVLQKFNSFGKRRENCGDIRNMLRCFQPFRLDEFSAQGTVVRSSIKLSHGLMGTLVRV